MQNKAYTALRTNINLSFEDTGPKPTFSHINHPLNIRSAYFQYSSIHILCSWKPQHYKRNSTTVNRAILSFLTKWHAFAIPFQIDLLPKCIQSTFMKRTVCWPLMVLNLKRLTDLQYCVGVPERTLFSVWAETSWVADIMFSYKCSMSVKWN